MKAPTKGCWNCRYQYKEMNGDELIVEECRRLSPRPLDQNRRPRSGKLSTIPMDWNWPEMPFVDHLWCGEWDTVENSGFLNVFDLKDPIEYEVLDKEEE